NRILQTISNKGSLSGRDVLDFIRTGGPLDDLMGHRDPLLGSYAGNIRSALLDAVKTNAQGDDAKLFSDLREQYKNGATVLPYAVKAQSEGGMLNPATLRAGVNRKFDGTADLNTAGDYGYRFLRGGKDSGTAINSAVLKLMGNAAPFVSGAVGGLLGHGTGTMGEGITAGTFAAPIVARAATKFVTNPARSNALLDAALNDNNAVASVPRLVRGAVPVATVETNRLRLAAKPK